MALLSIHAMSLPLFTLALLVSSVSYAAASAIESSAPCPLLGSDVPAPTGLSISSSFKTATTNLKQAIDSALQGSSVSGKLDSQTTSFSVDIFSIHDTDSLFTYHHSAPGLAKPKQGVSTVDSDTIYRIGSLSKLWTVYLYLIEAGDTSFNDPITKYVPELAAYAAKANAESAIDTFDWTSITVGALASQLAGVPRDAAPYPAENDAIAKLAGLPVAQSVNITFCGDPEVVQLPCDRAGFFSDYLVRPPVVAPFSATPIYSNAAFQILSYALENITSQSMPDLFRKLLGTLNMTDSSYYEPPTMTNSIIPGNASVSWYSANLLDETPVGGYYSSIIDLRKLGTSILNNTLLSPAQTRRWMRPGSFTSEINRTVGVPWEIYRAPGSRTSFIYAKEGQVGLYSSIIALVPDYDVGFTVLAAGNEASGSVEIIADNIGQIMYPALESAAKVEANSAYAGTYTVPGSTKSNIIVVTDSGPGISITNWTLDGQDVFPALAALAGSDSDKGFSLRLYPTGLKNVKAGKTIATAWRAVYQILPEPVDPRTFSANCQSWVTVDLVAYGVYGLDEFVFELNGSGGATTIVPKFLQDISYERPTRNAAASYA